MSFKLEVSLVSREELSFLSEETSRSRERPFEGHFSDVIGPPCSVSFAQQQRCYINGHGLLKTLMTKEKLFEELLAKRSAANQPQSHDNGDTVWHETGGLNVEQLKIGKHIIIKKLILSS